MESLESIRALLTTSRPRASAIGFPADVRRRVGIYAAARRARGDRVAAVALELGISHTSVSRWSIVEAAPPLQFVAVEVQADVVVPDALKAPPTPVVLRTAPSPATPTLVSPRGYRVEGLDLDALATLLGRLG